MAKAASATPSVPKKPVTPKLRTLVVVESPTKAKTMKKYLGPGYEVLASKGHIKDLPKKLGIDVEHGFKETYEVIEGKVKVLAEIVGAAKDADVILLATDPDREGEAIAVHIAQELESLNRPIHRVLFHEITKHGIAEGIANPQVLNENLYEAQRTRRVLDRIVGYDVSGLVWSKVAFGLSAGRVQSVALRLIVDRETEIEAFVPDEYWNVGAPLLGKAKQRFVARLTGADGEKLEVKNGEVAAKVKADLSGATYSIAKVTRREQKRNATAPYTTSKLQQDATNHLRFTAKRTMQVAQGLYEGVDLGKDGGPVGLITYMRTDSVRVSNEAIVAVREHIEQHHGKEFLPEKANEFKSRKSAQDAHEAIRPASLDLPPELVKKHLKEEQFKLYKLIWDRFVASQMSPAVYDQTAADVAAVPKGAGYKKKYELRATGRVLKAAGWLQQYDKGFGKEELAGEEDAKDEGSKPPGTVSLDDEREDGELPALAEGEALALVDPPGVLAEQKFTQPPPRFNEGSLVRELEKRGIGRPSTYAEIISKVQARDYVEKLTSGGFKPSGLGRIVIGGLISSNLDFIDPGFTAKLEEELDEVEAGNLPRVTLLDRFYKRFREQLDGSKKAKRWAPEPIDTGEICDVCKVGNLQKRWSKNGWFIGCSNYPKCKNTKNLAEDGREVVSRETVLECEKCKIGKLLVKTGRYGEFLGCSNYPKCDFTRPVPTGIACPKCAAEGRKGGDVIEIKPKKRGGRAFWGCANFASTPSCDFKLWQRPVREPCPDCGATFLTLAGGKKEPAVVCNTQGCGYKRVITSDEAAAFAKPGAPETLFAPVEEASVPPLPRRSEPVAHVGAE